MSLRYEGLGLKDRIVIPCRLALHDDFASDDEIETEAAGQATTLVDNGDGYLSLYLQASEFQLMDQSLLKNAFEQARSSEGPVYLNRGLHNDLGDLILGHFEPSWRLCALAPLRSLLPS